MSSKRPKPTKAKTDAANAAYQATEKADKQAAASAETAAKSISSAYINAGKEKEKAEQQAQKVIEDAAKQEQKAQENAAKASQKAYENFTRRSSKGSTRSSGLALKTKQPESHGERFSPDVAGLSGDHADGRLCDRRTCWSFPEERDIDAMSFEQAMAKVKKAVVFDNATGSFDQLAQRIRNLAKITPTTAEELANLPNRRGRLALKACQPFTADQPDE